MDALTGLDLLTGVVPVTAGVLAGAGGLFLFLRRGRGWWAAVAAAAAAAGLLAWGINWFLTNVSGTTAHDLPGPVILWLAVAVLAVLLMLLNLHRSRWPRKVLAPAAMAMVLLSATLGTNAYFGTYRTVDDLTGASTAGITALAPGTGAPDAGTSPVLGPVSARWVKPADLPTGGTISSVQIPGPVSGFSPGTGYVYLPPAYQAQDRPLLPVLVLVAGQPGSPSDWVSSGRLKETMDAFAAAHQGLAPVVIVPDANGSGTGNTMCMNSAIANADTYLAVDVPAWVRSTLSVDLNPRRWAFGGFSFGGTCAIQMAALHPDIYPSAIDLSGEAEPALSADRAETVRRAFAGNTGAFTALTPLEVMAHTRYPNSAVYFAAGAQDGTFSAYMAQVSGAAKQAGMDVIAVPVPGLGHSWGVPQQALGPALDWLAYRLGLVH
ncbi:alpha/beta hydrolase-fold protein [Arthrobacter sp. KFRI-F3372]|uniref:alpha/beta hydrolase n=1 Tax=Micrococcaceae TaxID=1268 RepID=UPI0027875E5A|nr:MULTISPECIES: alpha/beta hydrolase-fold protein [Micrococcaceae]MDP9989207.1 S-formylglutathione hydrolase FrmB [Arthrobacter oryzae]MEE2523911.1 alpha/beta hydrolase-fold protein [Pseudarthrobacter sp. J47]MEE2530340.1 alpha/beta hydrolase-fold protein [Pseudarthrobacter sp. J75]WHP61099.1 alpha/beta hydrolase-fold protein [Arthrobacter sp. KFRI-F3372]